MCSNLQMLWGIMLLKNTFSTSVLIFAIEIPTEIPVSVDPYNRGSIGQLLERHIDSMVN